nr:PAS domain-containing sensor histidine kinase [Lederbergia lenta]
MEWFVSKTNNAFIILDEEGIIKYINPSLLTILQSTYFNIVDNSILDIVHDEDKHKITASLFHLQQYESFTPFTSRFMCGDGTYCTLYWQSAERSEQGEIRGIALLIEKDNESKIDRDSANAWRSAFFDHTDDPALIIDIDGNIILTNKAFEKTFGWNAKGKRNKIYSIIYQTESAFIHFKNRVLQGERTVHHQIKKDGIVIPIVLTVSPIYDDSGVIYFSVITRSMKELQEERMLVEMQNKLLEEGDKLFLDITNNINEVICLYDIENGDVLYISPSIEQQLGISLDSYYKEPYSILEKLQVRDKKKLLNFFYSHSRIPKKVEFEIKDIVTGEPRWVESEVRPIVNEDGSVTRHVSISRDITELKEQKKQVRQLDNLGLIGQLAAGIAHEIRNPITSVKGFVQLLSEETEHKYNDIIMSEIDRIESIMNEFLVLAKPSKEVKLVKENINDVIKEIISFMRPEALLHNVDIITQFTEELQFVNCERKQMKQVVINLIKNAIEAMPSGGNIHVNTKAMSDGLIVIEVKDEGIGIANEKLEHVREPFYSDKETGTGLGLMISYKIIEDYNGTIKFSSKVGEGTIVRILLPSAS